MKKPSSVYQNPYLPKREKRGRAFLSKLGWLILIVFIIAIIGFLLFQLQWFRIRNAYESQIMDQSVSISSQSMVAIQNQTPIQILVIGYNQNANQIENHLIQTYAIKPDEEAILAIEFSPDLLIDINDHPSIPMKEALVQSDYADIQSEVETLIDSSIDYFFAINFSTISPLVDYLGGINIAPYETIQINDRMLEANETYVLKGDEVNQFLQRSVNETTIEYLNKEKLVFNGLCDAIFSQNHFFNAPTMIELAGQSIQTNLPINYWRQIFEEGSLVENYSLTTLLFQGITMIENNVTFEIIDENKQVEIQNQVRRFLENE
ncbi:LCP family glycopolymer transferase [Fundicoccus culcitae]|uniref:LCP family protein n=1 Tax=Fundicoccus culcitae TaxID=2969821 RepID=A0ABY5P530_9LACT|nr:LCP family protein [Fundicoccus culcitae]UUX33847.1 LCP family protein [Fundicoccus culcitae]